MAEIISINKIGSLANRLKKQGQVVVLAGGCFDILHPGHVIFLEKAKKAGDILIVLLESDQKVKELKGSNRPVHTQADRAMVLSALKAVDYVVVLPYMKFDTEYDERISKIGPDVIATTAKSANTHHQRSAKRVGAKLKIVTEVVKGYSSSKIAVQLLFVKTKLLLLSITFALLFTYFSYIVAKERWQKIDFDTMVKLQDHISRRFDGIFSYFSLLGSAEVTIGFCLVLAFLFLLRRRWLAILGWLMIIPASLAEVFGKLVLFHPGPPVFFHRSLLPTSLPSFYVHTDFSYPSGHMTRTIFIITIFACMVIFSSRNIIPRFFILCSLITLAFLMGLTRVYLGEHWLSDVLGGGLLGLSVGFSASILILSRRSGY